MSLYIWEVGFAGDEADKATPVRLFITDTANLEDLAREIGRMRASGVSPVEYVYYKGKAENR